jgi:hypothetical protein
MERDRGRPSHRVESGHCPTEPWVLNISMQPASKELQPVNRAIRRQQGWLEGVCNPVLQLAFGVY